MTLAEFKRGLTRPNPPANLAPSLLALWQCAQDDWDAAHKLVMDESGRDCAWVHAYLHRLEGDAENAGYWYKQARKPAATGGFEAEWDAIASDLLTRSAQE